MHKLVASFVVAASTGILGAATYENYTIPAGTSETFSTEALTVTDTLTVNGELKLSGSYKSSAKTLYLDGTAEKAARIYVNSAATFNAAESVIIGANGGSGYLDMGNWYCGYEFNPCKIYVDANASKTPGGDYVDIIHVGDNKMYMGKGVYNQSAHEARILFKPSQPNAPFIMSGNAWGATIFNEGRFVLEGSADAPIAVQCGGGGFPSPDGYPTIVCAAGASVRTLGNCAANFTATAFYRCMWIRNVTFGNAGGVVFKNLKTTMSGPVTFGPEVTAIEIDATDTGTFFDLAGNTLTGKTMRVGNCLFKNTKSTGGLVFAPAADLVDAFTGALDASVKVEMSGEGELALAACDIPDLAVLSGTLRITDSDAQVASLRLAAGSKLIVDGCTFTRPANFTDEGAEVFFVNGGAIAYPANDSIFMPNFPSGVTKRGAGRTVIHDPAALGGILHVAEGTLAFSRYGVTQPFYRWTFKSVRENEKLTSKTSLAPVLVGLWLWGTDGNRVAGDAMQSASAKVDPATLNPGYISIQCDYTWVEKMEYWHKYPSNLFVSNNNGVYIATPESKLDDPDSWFVFAYRLPADVQPVTGYDLQGGSDCLRVKDWTVEVSDDGTNWTTLDERNDQWSLDASGNQYYSVNYFDGGDRQHPTHKFAFTGYLAPGVQNMPETIGAQVDAGTTLDFSCVTGGQGVNALVYDPTLGAGTIRNMKVAGTGNFDIRGETAATGELGYTFEGLADAANFEKWTVTLNGKSTPRKLVFENGKLSLVAQGMVIWLK